MMKNHSFTVGDNLALTIESVAFGGMGVGRVAGMVVFVPYPAMYRYWQKAEFQAHYDDKGVCSTGFMGNDGRTLVPIDRCEILDESINAEYGRTRDNPGQAVSLPSRMVFWSNLPFGTSGEITRTVKGREITVPARGFFQANALLVDKLVEFVAQACPESPEGALLDCCCGSGLFALFAAREGQPVIGIDVDRESLRCAKKNKEGFGVAQAEFHRGPLEEVLPKLSGLTGFPLATAILDPPRTGALNEATEALALLGPETVIYVSCNPATQARDVCLIVNKGYELVELQHFDMFPRTKHVEVAAILSKAGNAAA